MPLGFAHGGYLLPILAAFEKSGADTEAALAVAGLPPDISSNPFRPIPHYLAVRFMDQAARTVGDESFGVKLLSGTKGITPEMMPATYLASGQGCLQILQSFVDHLNRTSTSVVSVEDNKSDLWIHLKWTAGEDTPPWSAELYVIGLLLVSLRGVLGEDWQPSAIKVLASRNPVYQQAGLPDCPIEWNAPTISLAINRQDMTSRIARRTPPPNSSVIRSVPNVAEASRELVRETVFGLMHQEGKGMTEIAGCFGLSKRSFHRYLDSYGLKFSQISETFKVERAMNVLQLENVSVTDLSLELGYDHPQNFARAFRRHVGLSPRQYRNAFSRPAAE